MEYHDGWYPVLLTIDKNKIDILKQLINYADKNKIQLKLNKKNKDGNNPLLINYMS